MEYAQQQAIKEVEAIMENPGQYGQADNQAKNDKMHLYIG